MIKLKMRERFDLITTFRGIDIFDSRHAVEEFFNHFQGLNLEQYRNILKQGLDFILHKYGLNANGNYMIISDSLGVRVPMEVRDDRFNGGTVAVVPTTLGKHELVNLRDEAEVFVEKNKNTYKQFKLTEGFNYFCQNGKVIADFEEVFVA